MMFLKKLIIHPVFEDEDKTHKAKLLNFILWGNILIFIPYTSYIILTRNPSWVRAISLALISEALNILLLILMHRGKVQAVSILQVFFSWLFCTYTAFTGKGVNGEVYLLGYPYAILVASTLLGTQEALITTGVTLISGAIMVVAQIQGWVEPRPVSTSIGTWLITLIVFPMLALLQRLINAEFRDTLRRAHDNEEALKQERDLLQAFMDNIPDNIYIKDTESRFIRVNKAEADYLKINNPQDAVGKTDADFFSPDLAKQFLDEEIGIIKTGQPIVNRIEFNPIEDGQPRWISATKALARDSSGNLIGTIGISREITQQKQIESQLRYERYILQVFMDNIPDYVYLKDRESRFIRINQAQARLFGLQTPEEAIGKTDFDFQSLELAKEFLDEEKHIIETGQPVLNRVEYNPRKDGTPRWLAASKVAAKDEAGNIIGIIGVSFDITKQRLEEERESNRRQILEKVLLLGKQITEVHDLQTTFDLIWHGVHDELGFERVGIFLYNAKTNSMDRVLGTYRNGMKDTTQGFSVEIEKWNLFKILLEQPDRYYFTRDFSVEHKVPSTDEMYGIKDYASVAVWASDKPVAAIAVDQCLSQKPITENQLEALRLFAGYAGLAIENARLKDTIQNELNERTLAKETEQQRRIMLEKVLELGKQVTEVSNLDTTLKRIWHAVHDGLDFDRLAIFLYNPEHNSMDGMLGTDNFGNMELTVGSYFPIEEDATFKQVLAQPDGLYHTNIFDIEYQIPKGHVMYGVKSYAAVAAWSGDKPIAIITVDQLITQRTITSHQIEALRLFAGYAGLAIENSRLKEAIQNELDEQKQAEEREQHRRIMLERIVKLGQYVTEVQDIQTTLQRIWHTIRNELDFDRLGIFLYDPITNTMNGTYGTNNQSEMEDERNVHISLEEENTINTAFIKSLQTPNGLYTTHNYQVDHNIASGDIMYGVKDYAAIAAWAGNKPVGVLCVDQLLSQRSITNDQLEALQLFAGYVGLAIENARLIEREHSRHTMLEKVIQIGKQVTAVSDFHTTLRNIWHTIRYDLDFDRVGIFLYNPLDNTYDGTYGTDRNGNIWDAWHVRVGLDNDKPFEKSLVFDKVLGHPNGFYFTSNYEKEFGVEENSQMTGVKHYAVVAVWAGDKPVAIVSVDQLTTGRAFTDEQLEALRLFTGYAGLAISNSKLNDALEKELIQRQTFISELETKNAELERFTYTVSHDLKSPLVTITGFLGYLEKDAISGNQERIKSSINRISKAAEKMQDLLNDLLELSRIGRLMNPPEVMPFESVVREAVEQVQGRLDERKVTIDIQKDLPSIYGDRSRLVEVMQNLIDNAVKYSQPNIQPVIEIGALKEQQGKITYFVSDNGIGIDPQFHERIFGLFNKLNPSSEGTGIGLSLVKRIIEIHNGQIWVESEAGKGATFYFSLPIHT